MRACKTCGDLFQPRQVMSCAHGKAGSRLYCSAPCLRTSKATKGRNHTSRKLLNGGSHTSKDVAAILALQHGKCAHHRYCGTIITPDNQSVDHIMPLALGGSNDRSNIQVLCRSCNSMKGYRDPLDHLIILEIIIAVNGL